MVTWSKNLRLAASTHGVRPCCGHFDRSDTALLCRSARWPITDEDRGKIKRKLIDALKLATRPRDIASLSKALIACEA